MKERGPIGGPRSDFYTAFVAMHAGGPYGEDVNVSKFAMPWAPPEPPEEDDESR